MEALWDDLSKRADVDITPAWHREVLAERDAAFRKGEIQSEDWEDAKQRILRETYVAGLRTEPLVRPKVSTTPSVNPDYF
jgi:hypothetical protein